MTYRTKQQVEDLVNQIRYLRSKHYRAKEIAYKLNISHSWCWKLMKREGIDANAPVQLIIEDFLSGASYSHIAERYKITTGCVEAVLKKARQEGKDVPYRRKDLRKKINAN